MKQDHYNTLGVDKNADADEIKKAYRRKAMKYHPDRNPNDKSAENKFKSIQTAYNVLSNPKKKREYDLFGGDGDIFTDNDFSSNAEFNNVDVSELFTELFEHFAKEGFQYQHQNRRPRRTTKTEYRTDVNINFSESINGCKKQISFSTKAKCPECEDHPVARLDICPECGGDGVVNATRKISVSIPPGIKDKQSLKISINEKNHEIKIILTVNVKSDKLFERIEDDVLLNADVPYDVAVSGGTIEIPKPDGIGSLKVTIPSGTKSSDVLRLKGQGPNKLNKTTKGDILIKLNIKKSTDNNKKRNKIFSSFMGTT